ncbi:MAG TPA: alpha/beta hydrolase-fold protein [Chitinophagaceae bacterium]|nr:alpha/beta hydrolase-fold protein [Chitinophagaceae bacterium]
MRSWLSILFILSVLNASAQYPRVDIPGSEVRKITSSIVTGQEYELQILLPSGYSVSEKKYPVVYLMDSQWDFPLVKSIYGQQYYDGFIPELIVVGVTWGGVNPNPDSLRARDYTPTKENRLSQSGGADQFLSFMKNELFPFIEKNYRARTDDRVLMGCSLGGLITLYTLFTQPELFTGYAAASPAIGWDREVIRKYEADFSKKKFNKAVRLYLTVGDVERGRPGFEKFAEMLKEKNYPMLSVGSRVLENTGHSGTKSETFSRGLQYIFEKPRLKLPNSILNKYTGSYQFSNGNSVELKNENNQLILFFSSNNKYILYAADETEYYSTAEFLNIKFDTENNTINGFQLNRYGNSQFLKRVN